PPPSPPLSPSSLHDALPIFRLTAFDRPAPIGAGSAAVGARPVCFFSREKILPADRAGFHPRSFPVLRFRMLGPPPSPAGGGTKLDRKSTRLNSSHVSNSYAV